MKVTAKEYIVQTGYDACDSCHDCRKNKPHPLECGPDFVLDESVSEKQVLETIRNRMNESGFDYKNISIHIIKGYPAKMLDSIESINDYFDKF